MLTAGVWHQELSDWVFTPLLAIPYAAPNGLTLFPEAAQQPRLYPLTDPFARARATAESKVRFVRRVGNRLFDVNTGEVHFYRILPLLCFRAELTALRSCYFNS